jgi:hypothetical protein
MLMGHRYAGMSLRLIGDAIGELTYPDASEAVRRTIERLQEDRSLPRPLQLVSQSLESLDATPLDYRQFDRPSKTTVATGIDGNGFSPSQPGYPPGFFQGRDPILTDSATAAGPGDKVGCSQNQLSKLSQEMQV